MHCRIIECSELTIKNGSCDPFATVTVIYSNGKQISKRTKVKKKTASPRFNETFVFEVRKCIISAYSLYMYMRAQSIYIYVYAEYMKVPSFTLQPELTETRDRDVSHYSIEGAEVGEVVVGLWHASPGMGEQPVFLGEVRVTLKGLQKQPTSTTTAWYVHIVVCV